MDVVSRLRAPSSSCESAQESVHEDGARMRGTNYTTMKLDNSVLSITFDEKALGPTCILDKRTGKIWRTARTNACCPC